MRIIWINFIYKALLEWQKEKIKRFQERIKREEKTRNTPSLKRNGSNSFLQQQLKRLNLSVGLVAKDLLVSKEFRTFSKEESPKCVMVTSL